MSYNLNFTKLSGGAKNVLSGKTQIKTLSDTLVQNFTVKPKNWGLSGFSLTFTEEESAEYSRQFSDETLDNGTVISQHSIREPFVFSVRGWVYNTQINIPDTEILAQKISNRFSTLGAYAPLNKLTGTARTMFSRVNNTVQNSISYLDRAIDDGRGVFESLKNIAPNETNIIKMFKNLSSAYEVDMPLTLEFLGFALNNMHIQKLKIQYKKDIEQGRAFVDITFREVREVGNGVSTISKKVFEDSLQYSASTEAKKGNVIGETKNASTLFKNLIR